VQVGVLRLQLGFQFSWERERFLKFLEQCWALNSCFSGSWMWVSLLGLVFFGVWVVAVDRRRILLLSGRFLDLG
jgi:hypothetical protein